MCDWLLCDHHRPLIVATYFEDLRQIKYHKHCGVQNKSLKYYATRPAFYLTLSPTTIWFSKGKNWFDEGIWNDVSYIAFP